MSYLASSRAVWLENQLSEKVFHAVAGLLDCLENDIENEHMLEEFYNNLDKAFLQVYRTCYTSSIGISEYLWFSGINKERCILKFHEVSCNSEYMDFWHNMLKYNHNLLAYINYLERNYK